MANQRCEEATAQDDLFFFFPSKFSLFLLVELRSVFRTTSIYEREREEFRGWIY